MKIFCIGRNYADHAREMNSKVPDKPMIFMKPETAVNPMEYMDYPSFTEEMHYELELVLYISKEGKYIPVEEAANYYSHVGLGIDFTARDLQSQCKKDSHPWEIAKAFDHSACLGRKYEKSALDMSDLEFRLLQNGEVRQQGYSKDLIFDFESLISYISGFFTLKPGDLIFTGTPEGVGPVSRGDQLEGFLGDELSLKMSINK